MVELNCWTPENKEAKKRYDREFLLSLKDKKLSKSFPDALLNFEMAVMEQSASKPSQSSMGSDFGTRSSYAGRSSFGGSSMGGGGGERDSQQGYNKGSMRRDYSKGQGVKSVSSPL